LGSTSLGAFSTSGTNISNPIGGIIGFRNQGSASLQVGGTRASQNTWVTTASAAYATENTGNAVTVYLGPKKAGAADYSIIEYAELWLGR